MKTSAQRMLKMVLLTTLACATALAMSNTAPVRAGTAACARVAWFPRFSPAQLTNVPGLYFVSGLKGYQQTEEHTCGPAALMSLALFYGDKGIAFDRATELRVAKEAGSRSMDVRKRGGKPGTTPEEMQHWLLTNGFDVTLEYESKEDGSALRKLRENLQKRLPTLVEWIELQGHWVVVVGYDTRGTDDPWDDVLIFADSFDRYDDCPDGYTYVNANRFYWLWFDAFYFDTLTWRTMLTATPRRAAQRISTIKHKAPRHEEATD